MIQYFLDHYELIISAFLSLGGCIASFVSLVKTRRSEALTEIVNQVPVLCSQIESLFPYGNGSVKLHYVLSQVEKLCKASRLVFDQSYFKEIVEKVLTAPSSKK